MPGVEIGFEDRTVYPYTTGVGIDQKNNGCTPPNPSTSTSSADAGNENGNMNMFFEGTDHSRKGPAMRLVRIFMTVPLAWVKNLLPSDSDSEGDRDRENQNQNQSQSGTGIGNKNNYKYQQGLHLFGTDRVVISSLLFWFDLPSCSISTNRSNGLGRNGGVDSESGQHQHQHSIPKSIKMALVRSAAHVGGILSAYLLENVKILNMQVSYRVIELLGLYIYVYWWRLIFHVECCISLTALVFFYRTL